MDWFVPACCEKPIKNLPTLAGKQAELEIAGFIGNL
jgi:hypothetical protein